ncbi:MAG TPA: hypothetical protein VLD39_04930, partial [Gammaproteobacteria bacterium]|nr:hypothetical protein [Gammaproteobacteria bacterium]
MSNDAITVTSGPAAEGERRAQMFPVLTPAQLRTVAGFGTEKTFRERELLWDIGQRNTDFYVV